MGPENGDADFIALSQIGGSDRIIIRISGSNGQGRTVPLAINDAPNDGCRTGAGVSVGPVA